MPGMSGRALACRRAPAPRILAGPVRANGVPAALAGWLRGGGVVKARCSFGSSAALLRSLWESSSQQHLPGRGNGLQFAANSPLLSSSQSSEILDLIFTHCCFVYLDAPI